MNRRIATINDKKIIKRKDQNDLDKKKKKRLTEAITFKKAVSPFCTREQAFHLSLSIKCHLNHYWLRTMRQQNSNSF